MSTCGKHIWASSLLAAWLLLGLGPAWAAGHPTAPETAADRACRLVQDYGQAQGGGQSIGSLVELNMRQWKPQSNRGIAVLGWRATKLEGQVYRVAYRYQEIGRAVIELPWRVDLGTSEVVPLTPLSARIQRMSQLL